MTERILLTVDMADLLFLEEIAVLQGRALDQKDNDQYMRLEAIKIPRLPWKQAQGAIETMGSTLGTVHLDTEEVARWWDKRAIRLNAQVKANRAIAGWPDEPMQIVV